MLPSQWRIRQTFDFITRNGNATTTYRIRAVPLEGNPWFNLSDAARVLGLKEHSRGGFHQHLRNLGADETRTIRRKDFPTFEVWKCEARNAGRMILISESGLYKLIMRSDKPQARAFQEWVTREVLPTIRKTGGYVLQGADRAAVGEGTVAEMPDVG